MARKGRNAPRRGKKMEKEDASKLAPEASMRPKARPSSKLAPRASMRPRARPNDTTMEASLRPRARPDDMPTVDEIGAIERGNRAAKRTAEDLAMFSALGPGGAGASAGAAAARAAKESMGMKKGGKVRGYGLARGGKVCKMR
jgi:hypothetical protein